MGAEAIRRILIDADGCPKDARQAVQAAARRYSLDVLSAANAHHDMAGEGHQVTDDAPDAADLVLANQVRPGDLVVTQDYGLAAMVLARGGAGIHPLGWVYDSAIIDGLLMQRHVAGRLRRGGVHLKGPAKRTAADRKRFEAALLKEIERRLPI